MPLHRTRAAVCLTLLCAPSASAQVGVDMTPPTSAECAAWTAPGSAEQALAKGGEGLSHKFWLCPAAGRAFGAVLLAARGETNREVLYDLVLRAEQEPDVAAAALQLTGDAGASEAARAAAMLVIFKQFGSDARTVGDRTGVALLSEPVTFSHNFGFCIHSWPIHHFVLRLDRPLPEDFKTQVTRVLDPLMLSAGTTPLVRNLARCLRQRTGRHLPLQGVDLSGFGAEHVCGPLFRFTNPVDWPLQLFVRTKLRDGGFHDRPLYLTPFGSDTFDLNYFGADMSDVTVLYHGRFLKRVTNYSGTPCPAPQGKPGA